MAKRLVDFLRIFEVLSECRQFTTILLQLINHSVNNKSHLLLQKQHVSPSLIN